MKPTLLVKRRNASGAIRWLAVVLAITCAFFSSNNWCFIIMPAAIAALVVDVVVHRLHTQTIARLAVAAVVGIGVGIMLRVGPQWAFRESFGVDPPMGVQDVRIWRHYLGGPGEHALIIEFTATPASLQSLLSSHQVESESRKVDRWHADGGGWDAAFRAFAGPAATRFARRSWMRIRPLESPDVFDLGLVEHGHLVLFCEPQTVRCVSMHVRL